MEVKKSLKKVKEKIKGAKKRKDCSLRTYILFSTVINYQCRKNTTVLVVFKNVRV